MAQSLTSQFSTICIAKENSGFERFLYEMRVRKNAKGALVSAKYKNNTERERERERERESLQTDMQTDTDNTQTYRQYTDIEFNTQERRLISRKKSMS